MTENNAIVMVRTESIKPGDRLFRALDEEVVKELMVSIRTSGIFSPLLVEKGEDGFTLLSGFNRLDAIKRLGLTEVPCEIVTANNRVAAIFDTDLIRRDLDHGERVEMRKIKEDYKKKNRERMEQSLIPAYQGFAQYLNDTTLQHICNIPVAEQQLFFNAIPQKVIADKVELKKLEKQVLEGDEEIKELREFKTKIEMEKKTFEDYKEKYEALQKTKQKDLEILVDAKKKEMEEEYRDADDNIRIAYENAKEESEKTLNEEIETQRVLAVNMSLEVDKRNAIIKAMQEQIDKSDNVKKSIEKEKVKLQNKINQQKNIVAAVSNPQTIVNRCKLIGMDADHIRNTIIQCGPDLWINERDTKNAIIKHLAAAIEEINEIQKFLDTIKPAGDKGVKTPLDKEE
ncbi:MAG: ParB N-terminal domain-containing protein [Proteobacteria bacterium]|jgi:ParB family chromosome partitioning protein|nr:ParB N-terminal domain-containing protein [Pseudomonadota bacterium]